MLLVVVVVLIQRLCILKLHRWCLWSWHSGFAHWNYTVGVVGGGGDDGHGGGGGDDDHVVILTISEANPSKAENHE